jgi:hypothetical protein
MRMLVIAAAALLYAGAAYAQSAVQTPGQPGSGYQAPATQGVNNPNQMPAKIADPSKPGSGFKAPEGPSAHAPANGPATNAKGELPKGGKNQD